MKRFLEKQMAVGFGPAFPISLILGKLEDIIALLTDAGSAQHSISQKESKEG